MPTQANPFGLDTVGHEIFFNPRQFNPRKIALVGSAEYIAELFELLARLGIQNFHIFSDKPLGACIQRVKKAVEVPGKHDLEVVEFSLSIRRVMSTSRPYEVIFVAHNHGEKHRLLLDLLYSRLVARAVVTVKNSLPATNDGAECMIVLALETKDTEHLKLVPYIYEVEDLYTFPCHAQIPSALTVNSFVCWWGHRGCRVPPSPLLRAYQPEQISVIAPFLR